ncbi:MAG: sigma 54-interacting transcriptional regulator [Pseudomonadota bacterium]
MLELVFFKDGQPCLRRTLGRHKISIGRDSDNQVQLMDETISRHHCLIEWGDGEYLLADTSTNGTLLNDDPIKTAVLKSGDKIAIGNWHIEVNNTSLEAKIPTISQPRQATSILNFDVNQKIISSQRLKLDVVPAQGKKFTKTITKAEAILGTVDNCEICINDDFVSRRHCRLINNDKGLMLIDLGSTNGTFLDGVRIEQMRLPEKGCFQIGKTVINYHLECATEALKPIQEVKLGNMFGQSLTMREVFALIEQVAPSEATVLITGESGTGKDLVARLLHEHSERTDKSFVSVNCGALPATLIESQLFGHEKGAFTGATERAIGLFEQAQGGTIFLDEIGEMPLELQTRLLQVLENRQIRRLGGKQDIDVNFRLIAATNQDLQKMVAGKTFRQDLFYRLYVVPIQLKPLREREGDVELLAKKFIKDFTPPGKNISLAKDAQEKLLAHNWPGNVRELKNVIQRAVLLTSNAKITAADIVFAPLDMEAFAQVSLESTERNAIVSALHEFKGNQSQAAKKLGIARTTLSAKVARFGINLKGF